MSFLWLALADFIRKRHLWILAVAAVLTVVFAFGIPRLRFKTGQDTIVPPGSRVFKDNLQYQAQFGGEPMLVLFEGDVKKLFASPNAEMIDALEKELRDTGSFASIVSPRQVLEFAAAQLPISQEETIKQLGVTLDAAAKKASAEAAARGASADEQKAAGEAARAKALEAFIAARGADAQRFGAVGEQSLSNPKFIDFLIFEADGTVRDSIKGVFPDPQHALMVGRLSGNMSIDEQASAAGKVLKIVEGTQLEGMSALASGTPVLIREINDGMRSSLITTGAGAVAMMIIVLFLVFRARWGILSLPIVLVGCTWAFGLMGFLGLPLTMVTISGLPILIGLGVDFAIQFHSRIEEETARQFDPATGLRHALVWLGPAVSVAVLAAVVGFMVLHISHVPMIRDFGSMLSVGAVILFITSLLVLPSVLYRRDRNRKVDGLTLPPAKRLEVAHFVRALTTSATGRIIPIALLSVLLALFGLVMDRRIEVQTDPERFISQKSPVLRDLHYIESVAGSSTELDIMVQADDVTSDEVLAWMTDFEKRTVAANPGKLVSSQSIASTVQSVAGGTPTQDVARRVLEAAPPDIKASLIANGGKSAQIVIALGDVTLDEQRQLIEQIEASVDAPGGVTATASGLAVIGIEAVNSLGQNRDLMAFAAIGAILVGLAIFYRNPAKGLVAVLPVLIAVSASSALLGLLRIELNPLSAVAGPLIIAMGTEFTVLLMSRYFEERERGESPREAMSIASLRIGRAITASGLTVVGGFGVLAFADFPLLEQFGRITAFNMALCLVSTLVVLPALLIWMDEETKLIPQPEERLAEP